MEFMIIDRVRAFLDVCVVLCLENWESMAVLLSKDSLIDGTF